MGIVGCADRYKKTVMDVMSNAKFYTALVHNVMILIPLTVVVGQMMILIIYQTMEMKWTPK